MTDEDKTMSRLRAAMEAVRKSGLLAKTPGFYVTPCENCGRQVCIGRCCKDPCREVKFND